MLSKPTGRSVTKQEEIRREIGKIVRAIRNDRSPQEEQMLDAAQRYLISPWTTNFQKYSPPKYLPVMAYLPNDDVKLEMTED